MDLDIAGEAALCTAATSGLGLASATALASADCDVAVCGITPTHVDAARDALAGTGDGDVIAVEADITDPAALEAFVDETADTFDGIDHVVTSAGGPPSAPFNETAPADWTEAYDLLVMSVVRTLQAARPHLADGGGTVTAITSRSVIEVIDDLVLSNAVRRAVIGLVKSIAREWAPAVRANAVCPGAHETARIREVIEADVDRGDVADYEAGLAEWAADIPLDRIGDPRELGDVVAFLASERASFVTGVALPVDGGSIRS
jgi:3-oxoacyl-[acyl-carrier protein] reductase